MTGSEKITPIAADDLDFVTPAALPGSYGTEERDALNLDFLALDATVGSRSFSDFVNVKDAENTDGKDLDCLFDSSEDFKQLMEDTGFIEYLIPLAEAYEMEDTEDDAVLTMDSDDSVVEIETLDSSEDEAPTESVVSEPTEQGDKTVEQLHAAIAAQFEKRAKEIEENVDAERDMEVFQRHLFEYRRYVARQEHLKLSPEVIRRRVFDFALVRSIRCVDNSIFIAWGFVLCNYTDVMGPDLLFLSECYTAVDSLLEEFEKFTFFGY